MARTSPHGVFVVPRQLTVVPTWPYPLPWQGGWQRPGGVCVSWAGVVLCLAASSGAPTGADQPGVAPWGSLPRITVGPGKGLTVALPEEELSVQLRARIQLRASVWSDAKTGLQREPANDVGVRRARLVMQGSFKDWALYLQLSYSNRDTEPDLRIPLRDAYVTYRRWRDVQIRVGQMKVPFDRQFMASSSTLQFVDRSAAVSEFHLNRDTGAVLFSDDVMGLGKRLAYWVGIFGGEGPNRLSTEPGTLVSARMEVRPFGGFDDLVEGDIERHNHPRVAVGAGVAFNRRSNRQRSTHGGLFTTGRTAYVHTNVDAVIKWHGASVAGQVLCRLAERDVLEKQANGETKQEFTRSGCGWFVQGGLMLAPRVEAALRASEVLPVPAQSKALPRNRELGAALNTYVYGHSVKLQADYSYHFGTELDAGGHQLRVQTEMYF